MFWRKHFGKHRETIRRSILQNFTVLIILISIAFFSAFLIVGYVESNLIYRRVVNQSIHSLSNDLKNTFNPVSTALRVMVSSSSIRNFRISDTEKLNKSLMPILKEINPISSVSICDSQGNGYTLSKTDFGWSNIEMSPGNFMKQIRHRKWDKQANLIEDTWETSNYDPRESDWYRNASGNGRKGQSWTVPYILFVSNQPGISISIPMKRENGDGFILAFDIRLSDLSEILGKPEISEYGVPFLLIGNRNIVVLPNNNFLHLARKMKHAGFENIIESKYRFVADGIEHWTEKQRKRLLKKRRGPKENTIFYFNSEDERWVGTIRPFPLNGKKVVQIGFVMNTDEIATVEEDIRHIVSIPVIFCLALLFAVLLTNRISKRYSIPMKKLVEQSKRISQMELGKTKPIDSKIREIQQLADSQEQMRSALEEATSKLKISNEKLEEYSRTLSDKVEERTHELKEKSEELEDLNCNLELKVKQEVEASGKKDKIMLQSARQAQMGEMISMIAHQWRQPLSSISTVTGNMLVFIELDDFEKEKFKELLKDINNHAQFLSSTINDFRNFFKPNKEKQLILLGSILAQTINIIGKSLRYKSIQLTEEYSFKTPINTYSNELTQVFLNILKNSQDAIIEKKTEFPEIIIKGYEEDNCQIIEISDNAGGISEENMDKIFEPYFSTKDEKTGTGLGLYMSKLIIEKHCQGDLIVENTDRGARFTIKLPV